MSTIDIVIPVHNGAQTIRGTLDRLLSLSSPEGWDIRLVVVDDGSSDQTSQLLAACVDERFQLVTLPSCGGRAHARNQGADRARGEVLLFLDSDCRPVADDFFVCLIAGLNAGADIVYGPITGWGEGFWPRYLRGVEAQRAQASEAGDHVLGMAAGNFAVGRPLFERVGGFDSDYRHYGFEDRDLIARLLAERPRVTFEPRCAVIHDAGNTVTNYCTKMREAARWTAPLFSSRHPDIYRRMAYSRLDAGLSELQWRALLISASRVLAVPAVGLADILVNGPGVPWRLQFFVLRAAAALSYLRGCSERRSG